MKKETRYAYQKRLKELEEEFGDLTCYKNFVIEILDLAHAEINMGRTHVSIGKIFEKMKDWILL